MITGELKNKIDGLWDIFAAGGLVNPLEVIEQITYLMFIHDLDDSDNTRAKESAMLGLPYQSIFAEEVKIGDRVIEGTQLKWSVFHDYPADKMYTIMQEWVFPFIKTLHSDKNSAYSKYMDDAIFKLPTPLVLSKVVDSLDDIYKMMNEVQTADVRGDVYEYLLSKIAQSGRNGQFRTPRHIIRMMVELMNPSSDEVICDPACGTSGFLVASGEYLKEKKKDEIFFDRQKKDHYMNHMFYGYDMDRTSGVELRLRRLGRKLELERIHPHKFRRSMATRAIDKGMPIEQVQKILGHSQIDTTMQYAMVNQTNVKTSHQKYMS